MNFRSIEMKSFALILGGMISVTVLAMLLVSTFFVAVPMLFSRKSADEKSAARPGAAVESAPTA